MVGELQHRQLELNKLLIKKDKEIQDYKDQGTLVSRSKFVKLHCSYYHHELHVLGISKGLMSHTHSHIKILTSPQKALYTIIIIIPKRGILNAFCVHMLT